MAKIDVVLTAQLDEAYEEIKLLKVQGFIEK